MPSIELASIDEITVHYSTKNTNTVLFTLPCGCMIKALLDCPNRFGDPTQFRYTCHAHFEW